MKTLPDGVESTALLEALADGWGLKVEMIDYAPVGFGSYHWRATDPAGTRYFVTVDDLDRKPSLGDSRDVVYDGLSRAFASAIALRGAGLEFVLAPISTREGEAVRRLGPRHSIALFPYVDGQAVGRFDYDAPEERASALALFARLHEETPAVASVARTIDLDIPGRRHLEAGLNDVGETWVGGPLSEPARLELARRASDVAEVLGLFDRMAREVAGRRDDWVVTHGEPHAGNVIRTHAGLRLVDWDTVAIAPRERDLWLLVTDTGDAPSAAADLTGDRPDRLTLEFFRLRWDLTDLAAYLEVLRSPHREDADTLKAYEGVRLCVAIGDRWAGRLDRGDSR